MRIVISCMRVTHSGRKHPVHSTERKHLDYKLCAIFYGIFFLLKLLFALLRSPENSHKLVHSLEVSIKMKQSNKQYPQPMLLEVGLDENHAKIPMTIRLRFVKNNVFFKVDSRKILKSISNISSA